ncbi:CBU_0585 family protein [Legionella spiritensis]|uniref:Uncharacterized protein n=1 Tax=Legionella spiritensis TaxID=452 RepID=A0A0W0Z5H0_LEGSP|nr:CBU_0585 family protein [Legionella spiritensis]KTD64400.1 hypothetical protein Lspi_1207 [Legionella spiritensis]SNV46099.1 Uncharacterised protein [Legionella spiritensis]VEG91035.1 Uncharacterised protein [Legionella spiritensis]
MSKDDINKAFVSPEDKFLFQFDSEHEKSASQLKEIKKHKRIAALRDNAERSDKDKEIWEEF